MKSKLKKMLEDIFYSKVCKCGKYKPTSTTGLIDDSCINCGGKPKEIKYM